MNQAPQRPAGRAPNLEKLGGKTLRRYYVPGGVTKRRARFLADAAEVRELAGTGLNSALHQTGRAVDVGFMDA